MKIAVVIRQVPDLIEPLEVDSSGKALDLGSATFILNESDDHALEQALLLKEAQGGSVSVLAVDFGDVDNSLYAAAAKGADQLIKLLWDDPNRPPWPQQAARMFAEVLRPLAPLGRSEPSSLAAASRPDVCRGASALGAGAGAGGRAGP